MFSVQLIVIKVIKKRPIIKINNNELEIRLLISRMERIILSNVRQIIPYVLIVDILYKLGLEPYSAISILRARLSEQGLSHVMSSR